MGVKLFHQQRVCSSRQAVPRQAGHRQAVLRFPQKIALFHQQRVCSSRQAVPRLPWEIALSHWQRVSSPWQVPLLPQRMALSRQRGLHLPRQSDTQLGLGLGRQVPPLGRMVRSLSRTALFPKGYFPRTMLPRKQGPPPVGITPHRVLPPWRNPTQSG